MLGLRLIFLTGCWGLLQSDEQVEWNRFIEFTHNYNKGYQDDPNELTNRYKIFKVTRDTRGVVVKC